MNAKRILLIDDDPVVCNIYQNTFRAEGYDVEVATNGEIALATLRQTPADLVILDLSIPGLGGVEVIKRLRSCPETSTLPVIALSNTYLARLVQAAWKAGATKCLFKAMTAPREVLEIVHKMLLAAEAVAPPAAGPVQAQPVTTLLAARSVAPLPAGGFADGGGPSTSPTNMEVQTKQVEAFLIDAPDTLAKMRNCHQLFTKAKVENLRLFELYELYRLTRSLANTAGLVGFRKIAQTASALEAFLHELLAKPAELTNSTIRTIAQGIDALASLIGHAGSPLAEPLASPNILVVDDESISRELILSALGKVGLPAISLDNPVLALRVLEQNRFALIFLDIEMPELGGLEVCERLRAMPSNEATPVVFVTAHGDFESRARSSLSGGNDFIAKPFLLLELAVKALTWLFAESKAPADGANPSATRASIRRRQEQQALTKSFKASRRAKCAAKLL